MGHKRRSNLCLFISTVLHTLLLTQDVWKFFKCGFKSQCCCWNGMTKNLILTWTARLQQFLHAELQASASFHHSIFFLILCKITFELFLPHNWQKCQAISNVNALDSKGNYSATLNNTKSVHWPLKGGLLHLVQWGGDSVGRGPALLYQM